VPRSTACCNRAANAATVWSASYLARLNLRSTACRTRCRTGLNRAAATSVEAATVPGTLRLGSRVQGQSERDRVAVAEWFARHGAPDMAPADGDAIG